MIDLHTVRDGVEKLIRQAGATIAATGLAAVHEKWGHYNFVTDTDVAVQELLKQGLAELIPESRFFAEEQENETMTDEYTWVVDPLDGTYNFIRGRHASCVSIALLKEKRAVLGMIYQPYQDELYCALRGEGATLNGRPIQVSLQPFENALVAIGTAPYYAELADATAYCFQQFLAHSGDIRRVGSAALDCCDVACGRADIFWEMKLSPWDFAAGSLLIEEAGGVFMMPYEDTVDLSRSTCILATNPNCRDAALTILMKAKEKIKA